MATTDNALTMTEKIERLEARLEELAPEFEWTVKLFDSMEFVTLYSVTKKQYGDPPREAEIRTHMKDVPDSDAESITHIIESARTELRYLLEDYGLTG